MGLKTTMWPSPTQLKSAKVMNPCGFVSSQSDGHQIPTSWSMIGPPLPFRINKANKSC